MFAVEVVMTSVFVLVFLGATSHASMTPAAPLAIGLAFAGCYLIAIPVTSGGLNPARSTAAILFGGAEVASQLWVYWLAPICGGLVGGLTGRYLLNE